MDPSATSTLGVTMGDPTGIGPELIVRLLCDESLRSAWAGAGAAPEVIVYGDEGVLGRSARALGLPFPPPGAFMESITSLPETTVRPGRPSAASGAAQLLYLEAALKAAQAGRLQGLCTAPIHKASAIAAGLPFPGHTELLAALLGGEAVMMLCGPSLRVALCTTHLPLKDVAAALSIEGVARVLVTTARALHDDFAVPAPHIVVAGLNPHAGEQGHLGGEEAEIIAPAIERARRALQGIPALAGTLLRGPEVPDALFRAAVYPQDGRRPDAVVAMYHDQGLIPLKLLDFDEGVNVTLGLPIVRTSPDHGTAHDIAGTGRARPTSMAAALRLCRELVARRRSFSP